MYMWRLKKNLRLTAIHLDLGCWTNTKVSAATLLKDTACMESSADTTVGNYRKRNLGWTRLRMGLQSHPFLDGIRKWYLLDAETWHQRITILTSCCGPGDRNDVNSICRISPTLLMVPRSWHLLLSTVSLSSFYHPGIQSFISYDSAFCPVLWWLHSMSCTVEKQFIKWSHGA